MSMTHAGKAVIITSVLGIKHYVCGDALFCVFMSGFYTYLWMCWRCAPINKYYLQFYRIKTMNCKCANLEKKKNVSKMKQHHQVWYQMSENNTSTSKYAQVNCSDSHENNCCVSCAMLGVVIIYIDYNYSFSVESSQASQNISGLYELVTRATNRLL